MTYPKYFVSYTVMDSNDAGANPFHHAFLTFSKQESQNEPIYVEDAYGFYSQPARTNFFWKMIGINFKLQNSHGILKREKFYELDSPGYTAKHFEISENTYLDLLKKEKDQIRREQEAIDQAVRSSVEKAIDDYDPNGQKISAEEKGSAIQAAIAEYKKRPDKNIELKNGSGDVRAAMRAFYKTHESEIQPETIYQNNLKDAKATNKKPDLHRFEFRFDINLTKGIHTTNSYTCKTQALDLLEEAGLLKRAKPRSKSFSDLQTFEHTQNKLYEAKPRSQSESDLDEPRCEIDTNDFGFAFPNTTNEKLKPLFLFSSGTLTGRPSNSSSKTYYSRDWQDGRMFHALQPNLRHAKLHEIQQELLKLKRLDKQLRQPADPDATQQMWDAQAPLLALINKFAAINDFTSDIEVKSICATSKQFRQDFAIKQPEVSASFIFLSWETLLSSTLTISALTIVFALNCMSAGIPFTTTVVAAGVVGLVSCFGLFGNKDQPSKTDSSDINKMGSILTDDLSSNNIPGSL